MAESQYTTPLIVSKTGVSRLNKIPLASKGDEGGYDEAWIQKIVFENPECLPVEEVDSTYQDIIPVCMELYTPVGPIDALYVTPLGQLVLLEAKLWRNPEARRAVVGQILDYAREFTRWSYEDLQREVSKRTGAKGNVLFELAQEANPDLDESDFVDNVSRTLLRGDFLLLIVGDGIREGVEAIAEYLDRYAGINFTLGLIEMGVYSINENDRLIQPRLLAKTTILRKTVIEFDQKKPEIRYEQGEREVSAEELNEDQKFYLDFWSDFIKNLTLDDPSQPMPTKPARSATLWLTMPPSGALSWITIFFAGSKNEVGVFLSFTKGEDWGNHAYRALLEDKEAINKEIGLDLAWESDGSKHRIAHRLAFTDQRSPQNRIKLIDYFSDTSNRFVNAFRPRLQRITSDYDH